MSYLDGHNIGTIGIKKEVIKNVNPIPDFTDGTPTCNPIVLSESSSIDISINEMEYAEDKTLNGQYALDEDDITTGNTNYTVTMGGNINKNGMGFVLAPFFQAREFSTNMVFKTEKVLATCPNETYSLYVPIGCNVNGMASNGAVLNGCKPISLEINGTDCTWSMTLQASIWNMAPAATELPVYASGHYNAPYALTRVNKSKPKFAINGVDQETTSVSLKVNYTLRDNKGFYDSNGVETGYLVGAIKEAVSYSVLYNTTDSATNKSTTWLLSHKDKTKISDLGVNIIQDVDHSIVAVFDGSQKANPKLNTPGGDIATFDTEFSVVGDDDRATSLVITLDDEYGDITTEL